MSIVMMKPLIHPVASNGDLGVEEKWKSWNTIVIQVDSGGSRTFVDGVEPESESHKGVDQDST